MAKDAGFSKSAVPQRRPSTWCSRRAARPGWEGLFYASFDFAAALAAAGAAYAQPVPTCSTLRTRRWRSRSTASDSTRAQPLEDVSGELILDEPTRQLSVRATIQVAASIPATTRAMGTCCERWFNAAQNRQSSFARPQCAGQDDRTAEVVGDLTMIGQTHPVTLNVTINNIGGTPNAPQRRQAGFRDRSLTRSTGAQ